jgi:hypothetical protein
VFDKKELLFLYTGITLYIATLSDELRKTQDDLNYYIDNPPEELEIIEDDKEKIKDIEDDINKLKALSSKIHEQYKMS